jgi:hypothetical protein
MTRQTVIGQFRDSKLGFILFVAVRTPSHLVLNDSFGHRHLSDIPVAHGAIDLSRNVPLVIEVNMQMRRKPIDSSPGNFLPLLQIGFHLLHFGTVSLDALMARHTQLHAGNTGDGRLTCVLVTEHAGDLFFHVLFMAENDRLLRRTTDQIPEEKSAAAQGEHRNGR